VLELRSLLVTAQHVQIITVNRCYTGNTVCLEGNGYGSWLAYFHCCHYECIITQNA